MSANKIRVGFDNLPDEIVSHLRDNVRPNVPVPHLYHVTELIGCLRVAYFKRVYPEKVVFDVCSLWNIYRGLTMDRLFTPLFEVNQRTYRASRLGVEITGTLDFVAYDGEFGEWVLYDLKCPANLFYQKKNGAGRSYILQVQSYAALAKASGELGDVRRLRVLMLADDVICEEVGEWPEILDAFLWPRALLLDAALGLRDPSILPLAEEDWRCDCCGVDDGFRCSCDVLRKKLSQVMRFVGAIEEAPEPEYLKEMKELLY